MATTYAQLCDTCPALTACRYTYADYYHAKSHGGIGCSYPFSRNNAKLIEAAAKKAKRIEKQEQRQAELFEKKAEHERQFAPRDWVVVHERKEYETRAKSAAAAINFVRYTLYGLCPMSSLPPFSAHPKQLGDISIKDAAARLARLTI